MKPCFPPSFLPGLLALCLIFPASAATHAEATTARQSSRPGSPSIQPVKPIQQKARPQQQAAQTCGGESADFSQWPEVHAFIDDMVERNGFDKAALQAIFRKVRHLGATLALIKPAPGGKPKNWQAYRARFVEPKRINAGVEFWNQHAEALAQAQARYGVPAEIIVGIIGVETIYGRHTGNFCVIDALTTLAFDYPHTANRDARMAFFRGELESTLLLARESGFDLFSLQGSYAGAIGWPQFMPGSIRRYAVDFDGDGRVDLRNSPVDAIGSVANFLQMHGWQRGEPLVFPATVADAAQAEKLIHQGLKAKFTIDQLNAAGVEIAAVPVGMALPADLHYGVIDLQNGAAPTGHWLATDNFFAIAQYNRSYFYAMSVIDLARAVRAARGQPVHDRSAR